MQTSPLQIALVTGGSRGIGRSAALALADRGRDLILTYRSAAADAREVVAQIEAKGRRAVALPLDLGGGTAAMTAFADRVRAALQQHWQRDRFDFLVNNAGSGTHAPFIETTEAQLDEMFAIHLKGPFLLTQALLPLMADGGSIVNISTGLSRYTYPGQSAYGAMKGGLDVLTRYLARELGPRKITANVVAPGGVATDFAGGAMRNADLQRAVAADTAIGRMGEPEDIGDLVALLLAPESRWVTGQRIEATGGYQL